MLVSAVPRESLLGPIPSHFYTNGLLLFAEKAGVCNYEDNDTLMSSSNTLPDLVKVVEEESKKIQCFAK